MAVYRRAREEETPQIEDLLIRTFTGEQGIPAELISLSDKDSPQWFCAEEDGKLVGVIAFFRVDGDWHSGRFALEPACRGRHIGSRLLTYAFREMLDSGVEEVLMEVRPVTEHILLKLGAEVTSEPYPFYGSTCTSMRLLKSSFREP